MPVTMCTASAFLFISVKGMSTMSEYKALYRKWRPFNFDDVCGQDAVTDILKYEVENDKISHAYLFCGSRGTGKTSCAKILAKAVNCLSPKNGNPCNECEACRSIDAGIATDVIEMDAASNNGVDNVRSLKDEINFTPALLKYRVYIIDEVHMMSGAAFNALLKTLEEPPTYVVFILATTEYNKLPTTIVSRCQRFDFRRISSDVIMSRLKRISDAEGIDLGDDGARMIARASRGGMRDAVSLLELCAGSRAHIDSRLVAEKIGSGDRSMAYKLIDAVGRSDYSEVYSVIADVVMSSGDISVFWQEIIDSYRDMMVVKNAQDARSYLDLTDVEHDMLKKTAESFSMARLAYHTTLLEAALSDMQRAINSKRSIAEIALTRMCDARTVVSPEALAVRVEELEKQVSMLKLGVAQPARTPNEETAPAATAPAADIHATAPSAEPEAAEKSTDEVTPYRGWQAVVDRISELKGSLSGGLKGGTAFRRGKNEFIIRLNDFFAARIRASQADFTLLRGVIAEYEGISPETLTLTVVGTSPVGSGSAASELDKILK